MIIALLILIAFVLIFGAEAFIELIRGLLVFAFGLFVLRRSRNSVIGKANRLGLSKPRPLVTKEKLKEWAGERKRLLGCARKLQQAIESADVFYSIDKERCERNNEAA